MKRGFTFIEVVVSILLLTLGIALLINMFPVSFGYLGKSVNTTIASFLAQEKMEEMLAESADDPSPADGAFQDFPQFSYHIEKKQWSARLKEIKVSILENLGTRKAIAVEYSTLQGGMGVADIVDVPVFSSSPSNSFGSVGILIADTRNRCLWFKPKGRSSYSTSIQSQYPSGFPLKKLKNYYTLKEALIPGNGIPSRIRVCIISTGSSQYEVYVHDSKNNCIWGAYAILAVPGPWGPGTPPPMDYYLYLTEDWVKICDLQ